MSKPRRSLCVLWGMVGTVMIGLAALAAGTAHAAEGGYAKGLIVKLRDATPHQAVVAAMESAAARGSNDTARFADGARWQRVLGDAKLSPLRLRPVGAAAQVLDFGRMLSPAEARDMADKLRQRPDVEWVVPNEREKLLATPNDPRYPGATGQWWLQTAAGSSGNVLVDRRRGVPGFPPAWDTTTGLPSAIVAVLDTGSTAHNELSGLTLLPGYDMVQEVDFSGDGDGRDANASDPGDFVSAGDLNNPVIAQDTSCQVTDSSWHGTTIMGMLAAHSNDSVGAAAIHWNARVLPVRVAGKCGAFVEDIVDGIYWAVGVPVCKTYSTQGVCTSMTPTNPVANRPRVINISFGGSNPCNQAYQTAIDAAWQQGAVVVAAAGNEHNDNAPSYGLSRPASCDKVVGVVALNRDGFKSNYSNFGAKAVIATVGGDDADGAWGSLADSGILTLSNAGAQGPGTPNYAYVFGTSFSAPIVSGAISLMLSANAALTPQQIVDGLVRSARPHVTSGLMGQCSPQNPGRCICTTTTCGAGILDAQQALLYALQPTSYVAPARAPENIDSAQLTAAIATGGSQDRPANTVAGPAPAASSAGGGGGGALDIIWLLLLTLATLLLWRVRDSSGRPAA